MGEGIEVTLFCFALGGLGVGGFFRFCLFGTLGLFRFFDFFDFLCFFSLVFLNGFFIVLGSGFFAFFVILGIYLVQMKKKLWTRK